ncbi:hypothetical protein [Gordonia polyisoprenivorans]|uniref:hypothetical protein n=1 Tax=Gordonia polyisoprenivorans TaxID=84595 RepID=UPI002010F7CB|nr:hypothetical protein [Gordonia polyisoprenivorans]
MLARVGIAVFGDSPTGLRVLPALLAGSTVLIVALLARELRAGSTAQVLAWLVISLLVVRMLRCAQPHWWVPIGCCSCRCNWCCSAR